MKKYLKRCLALGLALMMFQSTAAFALEVSDLRGPVLSDEDVSADDANWEGLVFDWGSPAEEESYDTTPIANGIFGARVTGGVEKDTYHLTSTRFWSGGVFDDYDETGTRRAALEQTREDLLNGDIDAAEQSVKGTAGETIDVGTPLPLGDISVTFEGHDSYTGYSRELDVDKAMMTTKYTHAGTEYYRNSFVSLPDNVMVIEYTTGSGAPLSMNIAMNYREEMEGHGASMTVESDDTISMWSVAPSAVSRENTTWDDE